MAYSYDSHSYRPSSKHDSFLQPSSHDIYGYSRHSRSSSRIDANAVPASPMSRNKSSHGGERRSRHQDDEYYKRPTLDREETYPSFSRRSRSHRRNTWPPRPVVEDEVVALAKEYPRSKPRTHSDEGVARGEIDQTPILIELENHDRRYVLVPNENDTVAKDFGRDEKEGRPRREEHRKDNRPPLRLDVEEPNLFSRRQPSPYAFTRTPQTASNRNSAEFILSPAAMTPKSAANARPTKEPRRGGGRSGGSSDTDHKTDGSDVEPIQVSRLREKKQWRGPRASFTEPILSTAQRPELKRFSTDYSSQSEIRKAPTSQPSSELKSSTKPPKPAPLDADAPTTNMRPKPYGTMPVPISIPQHVRAESFHTTRPRPNDFAASSPHDESAWVPTPPGPPRSSQRSYETGKRISRPNSPAIGDIPAGSYRVSRDFANPKLDYDAPKHPNQDRLRSGVRHASLERPLNPRIDLQSPSPAPPRPFLPYPTDEHDVHMPNHEHFQSPVLQSGVSIKPKFDAIPTSPPMSPRVPPSRTNTSESSNSVKDLGIRQASGAKSSKDSQKLGDSGSPLPLPTKLPTCPRRDFSRKYGDWYTLRSDQSFDICPTCLDEIIWPTPFRKHFVEAPPRASTVRTRCDFGSPWVRLAWLLTLKQQKQDLDLVYRLSAIGAAYPECADAQPSLGPWFGLRDQNGLVVPSFTICSCDVKYIETLFPSLAGSFVRLSPSVSSRQPIFCSMRRSSRRFPMYLDLLEDIDDDMRNRPGRASPHLKTLIDVVRAESYKQDCPRDNPLADSTWHFIPTLPEFTACEECYDAVIWPSTKSGSEVANQVTRVLEPLPFGKSTASCQLYSPRMRRVWDRAVKYGGEEGMKYLTRKFKERRVVEDDLRKQQVEIGKALDRAVKVGGAGAGGEKERLRRELERIAKEWEDWE